MSASRVYPAGLTMFPGESKNTRLVTEFYGGKTCVVTGQSGDVVDFHHLDEKHANWSFENVLPLERGLNGAIETNRARLGPRIKKWPSALPVNLSSQSLLLKSETHLKAGYYPAAYACGRLAAFLAFSREHDLDNVVASATQAIYAARPAWHLCLAVDTLDRNVLGIARKSIASVSMTTWAGLAKELACYHLVGEKYESYANWSNLGRGLVVDSTARPDVINKLRMDQHQGFFLLKKRKLAEARESLEETTEKMHYLSYNAGPANNFQHILAAQLIGDIDGAGDTLELIETKIGNVEPLSAMEIRNGGQLHHGRSTYWTHQGLLLRKADFLLKTGDSNAAYEYVSNAEWVGKSCGIQHNGMLESTALMMFRQRFPRKPSLPCDSCLAFGYDFFQHSAQLYTLLLSHFQPQLKCPN